MDVINGQKFTACFTLHSMYDNDCVKVVDDKGKSYRLPASTILQMVNEFMFTVEEKRVHKYLVDAMPKDIYQADKDDKDVL